MIQQINAKIKELYGSKATFCEEIYGIDQRDSTSKFNTVENKLNWLDEFLKHLNLEIQIIEKNENI